MNNLNFTKKSPGQLIQTKSGYWSFYPNPLPPKINWSSPLVTSLTEATRNLAHLAGLANTSPSPYALSSPHLLVSPFIHQEAVRSSMIEGTRASFNDLYMYEANQLSFFEDPADVREVHNYVRALEYGLERCKTLPVSLRLIREINGILMEGVRGEHLTPGEFRRSQNWIGTAGSTIESATYVPPPVDEMIQALNVLEKYIHSESDIPQLVRIGLIHYQFEAIHPFLDGNGRIGRLLISLLLIEWGLISQPLIYLSAFFEAHRLDYYDSLLAISLRGEWENWLLFYLRGVSSQSLDAIRRIESIDALRKDYRERLGKLRASIRLENALDILFERPILNIHQLMVALDVPFITAQRYVEALVKVGILREVSGKRRNRIYQSDEILQAYNT